MSNTQTQNFSFTAGSARPKPDLICLGTVGEIKEPYLSTPKAEGKAQYVVQPIVINAVGTGRAQTQYLCYRPEWFVWDPTKNGGMGGQKVNPDSLKELEDGKAIYFVYSTHIADRDKNSSLRGLCGSQDRFEALSALLFNLEVEEGMQGPSIEAVQQTLADFFAGNVDDTGAPVQFGYRLVQQKTDTGEVDENGHKIKILDSRYQIDSFFDATAANLARERSKAEKSGGKALICFDVPF